VCSKITFPHFHKKPWPVNVHQQVYKLNYIDDRSGFPATFWTAFKFVIVPWLLSEPTQTSFSCYSISKLGAIHQRRPIRWGGSTKCGRLRTRGSADVQKRFFGAFWSLYRSLTPPCPRALFWTFLRAIHCWTGGAPKSQFILERLWWTTPYSILIVFVINKYL